MDCPVTEFPHMTTLQPGKAVEYSTPVSGKVSGEIPVWLRGSWYRNGPGVIHFKDESVQHWFDGMALVRRFKIENGKVTYTSRLVAGDSLRKNTEAGRVVIPEFGTRVQPPDQGLLNKIKNILTIPEFTDNCLINFIVLGENIFAITESNFIRKIDAQTLETQEKVDLSQFLPINIMASHPLVDNVDGSLYLFSSSIFSKGRTKYNLLNIPKIDAGKDYEEALSNSKHVGSLDSSWRVSPSYHHSFSMSENYAVFVEMPLKIDIPKMSVAHLRHMSYSECIDFLPDTQTHIFLIDKKTGKKHPITFKTNPLVVYHHINAYEENDHVVIDMCCYSNNGFYYKYLIENLNLTPQEFLEKYSSDDLSVRVLRVVLPLTVDQSSQGNLVKLSGTSCTAEMSKDGKTMYCQFEELLKGAECPSINDKFSGQKYRYFYSSGGSRLPPGEKLIKIDLQKRECVSSWQEKGCWLSQPTFVSKPEAKEEDEGIILSSVSCEDQDSFLLILNAESLKEIARIHFQANIPPCLHGVFVPSV